MTIEKLKSGSYRIRQMIQGRLILVTIDHKPTKSEATELIAAKLNESPKKSKNKPLLFKEACRNYIEAKNNVLSPSTIRGYESILRNLPESILNAEMGQIDTLLVQQVVNEYSMNHSPKSVYNLKGFILAVLGVYMPGLNISVTTPQRRPNGQEIPTDEDVKRILVWVKDNAPNYYVALSLACMSLRRSEIIALTIDDLNGNALTVNKAKVQDDKGNWHIKTTKTTASDRIVYLPSELVEEINKQGYIYQGHAEMINRTLLSAEKALNIPHYTLHRLRHYFASKMSTMTDEATVLKMGGWTPGSDVMKRVYRHSLTGEEKQQELAEKLGQVFF